VIKENKGELVLSIVEMPERKKENIN